MLIEWIHSRLNAQQDAMAPRLLIMNLQTLYRAVGALLHDPPSHKESRSVLSLPSRPTRVSPRRAVKCISLVRHFRVIDSAAEIMTVVISVPGPSPKEGK